MAHKYALPKGSAYKLNSKGNHVVKGEEICPRKPVEGQPALPDMEAVLPDPHTGGSSDEASRMLGWDVPQEKAR